LAGHRNLPLITLYTTEEEEWLKSYKIIICPNEELTGAQMILEWKSLG